MEIKYFLVIPLIVWLLVNISVVRSIRLLSKPKDLLKEVDLIESDVFTKKNNVFSEWCKKNGFEHEKYFHFSGILNGPPIECSAWWSETDKTWALIYITSTDKNVDFVSTFSDGTSITTASTKDSLTLPLPPESYFQAFTRLENSERYGLHKQAIADIEHKYGASRLNRRRDLFAEISDSILRQTKFIKKMRFWYLRGSYWYFVTRNLKVNKPVK